MKIEEQNYYKAGFEKYKNKFERLSNSFDFLSNVYKRDMKNKEKTIAMFTKLIYKQKNSYVGEIDKLREENKRLLEKNRNLELLYGGIKNG